MAQLIKKKASYTNETPGECVDLWMYLFKSREKKLFCPITINNFLAGYENLVFCMYSNVTLT